jgi:hypothetical protein
VRRPLRPCWRPSGLRCTYVTSVLVKKLFDTLRNVRGQEKDAAFREKDPIGWETKSRLTKRLSIDTRLAGI